MSTRRPFTLIAALLFALMMLVHLYRIVTGFQIVLGSRSMPMSVSWIAIVVTGVLAVMLYRDCRH